MSTSDPYSYSYYSGEDSNKNSKSYSCAYTDLELNSYEDSDGDNSLLDIGYDEEIKYGLSTKSIREYDEIVNGEVTRTEIQKLMIISLIIIIIGVPIVYLMIRNQPKNDYCKDDDEDDEPIICFDKIQIVFNILSFALIFILICTMMGIIAVKKNVKIGYTRKILHFSSHFLPFVIDKLFPMKSNIFVLIFKFWAVLLVYLLIAKPIRRRFWLSAVIFRAIDRPEDRPYTLSWIITQFIASSSILATFSYLWSYLETVKSGDNNYANLTLIVILINGLGDGLAEPVGIRWGKHKYTTKAIWYNGRFCNGEFTRSYEGSAIVAIVSMLSVALFYNIFTVIQLIVALVSMPIVMTTTEAFAPRSWDNPFLTFIGSLVLFGIIMIPK
jgi:dolichol kinase